jgi:hypothetical protein
MAILTAADIEVLNGSINRCVRLSAQEDAKVKNLYRAYLWKYRPEVAMARQIQPPSDWMETVRQERGPV